jgi:hypothetical protein
MTSIRLGSILLLKTYGIDILWSENFDLKQVDILQWRNNALFLSPRGSMWVILFKYFSFVFELNYKCIYLIILTCIIAETYIFISDL